MKLRLLDRTHPDFDKPLLQQYSDLVSGGRAVKKNIQQYLKKNEVEPPEVYKRRCDEACYINYAGPIAGYFASYLFTSKATIARKDGEPLGAYYKAFKEDVDAAGADLDHFMAERFVEALVCKRSYWRVEPPAELRAGMTVAERDRAGAGNVRLVPIPTINVVNWRRDTSDGGDAAQAPLLWILERTETCELEEIEDEHEWVTCTWTRWHRDLPPARWQYRYRKDVDKPPNDQTEVPEVDPPEDIEGKCPVVEMRLPDHLWLMQHIADPQLEHFRQQNALSWALKRNAFAMLWFFLNGRKKLPPMGSGRYGILGKGEDVKYVAPDGVSFDQIRLELAHLKDEIHRVAQQMARGIDNSATSIGRSGESKREDAKATEVVLREYGKIECAAEEETMDRVADARGDADIEHHVSGRDTYHLVDAEMLADVGVKTDSIQIKSRRYWVEKRKRLVRAELPDLSEDAYQEIDQELETAAPSMEEMTQPPPPPPPASGAAPGDVEEDGAGGADGSEGGGGDEPPVEVEEEKAAEREAKTEEA